MKKSILIIAAVMALPLLAFRVATTNSIVSGTASSGKYSGTPASATYLGAGEKLVFTGTAAGGFLRIILE